jgi:hypothetical protein
VITNWLYPRGENHQISISGNMPIGLFETASTVYRPRKTENQVGIGI